MRCNAMLFALERIPSTRKAGQINSFMTFVDVDTGESFRTYVDDSISREFKKFKRVDIELSLTLGEYQGKPQMNVRIISMLDALPEPDLSQAPQPVPAASAVRSPMAAIAGAAGK